MSSCRLAHISPSAICSRNGCSSPALDRVHITTREATTPHCSRHHVGLGGILCDYNGGDFVSTVSLHDSEVSFLTYSVHSKSSSADPSFALAAFKEAKPVDGPPSEWIQAGVSRSYYAADSDMKDKMDAWDKEWAKLEQKK